TQAYKHPAPAFVVQVEIVLVNPALLEFQVRAVVLLSANRHQDPGWLSGLENHGHAIGRTASQILMYEVIAPPFIGRFHNGSTPFFRSVLQPVLELIGDFRQGSPGHSFSLSVGWRATTELWTRQPVACPSSFAFIRINCRFRRSISPT